MADLAKLVVRLEAESSKLTTELQRANRKLGAFEKSSVKVMDTVKGSMLGLAAAGALIGGAFVVMTKKSLDAADAIAKAAEKTGFATDSLQELRFAADQNGASFSDLDSGLARFTKRLGLARMATGAAADTYKKLGIDLSQTNEQVFRQVVNTLAGMESQTDRLALTTRLFGDDAQKLELTFRGGTKALDAYAKKAQRLGIVLDADLLRSAEAANDQLSTMKQILDAQFTRAFVELAPIITQLGEAFANAAPHIAAFVSGFAEIEKRSKLAVEGTIETIGNNIERTTEQIKRAYEVLNNPSVRTVGETMFGPLRGPYDPESLKQYIVDLNTELQVLEERLSRSKDRLAELNTKPPPVDQPGAADTSGLYGGGDKGAADKAHEAYIAGLQKRYEALDRALLSEQDLEILRNEEKKLLIEEARHAGLIDQELYHTQLEELEQQHQDRLLEMQLKAMSEGERFNRLSAINKTKTTLQQGAILTQGMSTQNKTMFELNKRLALANAVVSLPSAVLKSFENAGGYPWGIIPAGLMLATGLAQIQAIKSSQFSSGGTAPSLTGSGATSVTATVPTIPELTPDTQSSSVTIQFIGDVYGMDEFEEVVVDIISTAVNDQDVVIIDSTSRQAAELLPA